MKTFFGIYLPHHETYTYCISINIYKYYKRKYIGIRRNIHGRIQRGPEEAFVSDDDVLRKKKKKRKMNSKYFDLTVIFVSNLKHICYS